RVAFRAVLVERQADHHTRHGVAVQQGEQLAHGEALAGTARQGGEGLGEGLGLIGQGEADAALAPIHAEQPPRPAGHPCCIEGKVRRSAMRRSRITSMLPVPLNSSKITSSIREPVSMSAVPTMVSEPPPSILRAAPKNRLGFCSAFASTPPERILPE